MDWFAEQILKLNNTGYREIGRLAVQEITLDTVIFDVLVDNLQAHTRFSSNYSNNRLDQLKLETQAGPILIKRGRELVNALLG